MLCFLAISQNFLLVFYVYVTIAAHLLCVDRSINVRAVCGFAGVVFAAVGVVALVAHATCIMLRIGMRAGCCLLVSRFFTSFLCF